MSRRGIAVSVVFAVVVHARGAVAQEANDKAAADVLFEQGRELLNKDMVAAACPKLEESLRLDRGIGTMLYLAECWSRAGKTASAWATFREAAATAQKERDPREKIATEKADQLLPTLSKLTIQVARESAPTGLAIVRDGHAVGDALWNTEAPVDPGEHVIEASAPGYKPWTKKITVGAKNDRTIVAVPPLDKAPVVVAPPPPARDDGGSRSTGTAQRVVGLSFAGIGLLGVGVGTAFGLSAIAKNDRADEHCTDLGCDPDGISLGDRANSDGTIATIAVAAGAALIVGGAVLFFTAPRANRANTSSGMRSPAWSPGFRW